MGRATQITHDAIVRPVLYASRRRQHRHRGSSVTSSRRDSTHRWNRNAERDQIAVDKSVAEVLGLLERAERETASEAHANEHICEYAIERPR